MFHGCLLVFKPEVYLFEEGVDGFFGVDGGDFLALTVDDGFFFAATEGDVGELCFAGAVDDTAHDGDGDGCLDVFQGGFCLLDEGEQVDFGAAAGGAGDEFGTVGAAQAQGGEDFPGDIDFEGGVGGERNANGIADAVGQEGAQGGCGADGAGLGVAGVGDAEVEGVVEALADGAVDVDGASGVVALGGEDELVEMLLFEDADIVGKLVEHEADQVAVVLGLAAVGITLFADAALVDADADGGVVGATGVNDALDLLAVVDVAGVESDFVDSGLEGFQGALVVEVDVGDDGDGYVGEDLGQGGGVLGGGHGQADDFAAVFDEGVDLGEAALDVAGGDVGHALDGNGCGAADGDVADVDGSGGRAPSRRGCVVVIHGRIVP